jgi:hypothetical protein
LEEVVTGQELRLAEKPFTKEMMVPQRALGNPFFKRQAQYCSVKV